MKRSSRPQQDDDLMAILDSKSPKAAPNQRSKKRSSKEEKKLAKKRNKKAACKTEKTIQVATAAITTGANKKNTIVSKYNVMMPTSVDSMYKTAQPQR